jgi:hypothetical protein
MDGRFLNFHLPELSRRSFIWGSDGYEDAQSWPLLPLGTMMAGDPISNFDGRRVWINLFCIATFDGILAEDRLPSQEKEEKISRHDKDIGECLSLALDLALKAEEEWSPYEKRRLLKLSNRISRRRLLRQSRPT